MPGGTGIAMRSACPTCRIGTLCAHVGLIEREVFSPYPDRVVRRAHLGAFVACDACEYCAEGRAPTAPGQAPRR